MKAKNDLFLLIKSLSKTEKRYFKLYSSLQTGAKTYMKLFEFADKMKIYDENKLRSEFKNEKFISHLPFTKRYLYNSIIKSLLAYNSERSVENNLTEQLMKAKLLYNRSLFSQAAIVIAKAKILSKKYERDYIYFELVRMEIQVLKRSRYGIDTGDSIFAEEKYIIEKLQSLYNYSKLYSNIANLRLTHGFAREGFSYSDPEYGGISGGSKENLSVKEKYHSLLSRVRISSVKGDMNSMLHYAKEVLELIESNPEPFEDDNSLELIQAYIDIFYPSLKTGRFKDYHYYLKKFKSLTPKSPVDEINIFVNICLSEIVRYLTAAEFKEGIDFTDHVESGLVKYSGKIQGIDESALLYNITRIFIGAGEYEKALEYSNRLLNRPLTEIRPDMYCYAKILNLIIHYELGNDELTRYLVISVYKLLKKMSKLYRFEVLLLSFLRKLPAMKTNEDFTDNLIFLRKEMLLLSEEPFEKNVFIYFDFISWAESKIYNKTFEEVVKSKLFMESKLNNEKPAKKLT